MLIYAMITVCQIIFLFTNEDSLIMIISTEILTDYAALSRFPSEATGLGTFVALLSFLGVARSIIMEISVLFEAVAYCREKGA